MMKLSEKAKENIGCFIGAVLYAYFVTGCLLFW